MKVTQRILPLKKHIALIAHDHYKNHLLDWCKINAGLLATQCLFATGTTGSLIKERIGLSVECLLSGPMGGDQQIGALIAEKKIDILLFFWDPLTAVPHDPDVRALLRLATVWNIPVATNRSTADALIVSDLFKRPFTITVPH